jgi:L-seryl-tRNA(Ser) seleniumtransferase
MKAESASGGRKEDALGLRGLPAVEVLLESPALAGEISRYSRPLVTRTIRQVLTSLREKIRQGTPLPSQNEIIGLVQRDLATKWPGFMSPVINATGVILHTNLGRAPLPPAAVQSLSSLAGSYTNLESDPSSGQRGIRIFDLRRLLCLLTGAEDALVVNNNAAAVLLVLVSLAHGREAVVSRGELVQIGGGFRVPEILEQSGVTLREAGTTNQTYAADYESAINENTALLLKVHPSNFEQRGFVHEASVAELAAIACRRGIPLVYDLGSGALLDSAAFGLEHEPTVQESLAGGADVVCFSGDKLMGGPQAGIIVGKKTLITAMLKHPLLRVVRLDKLSAMALEATVKLYLEGSAEQSVPVWQMMGLDADSIDERARLLVNRLNEMGIHASVRDGRSMVGGGSLPEQSLPTRLVAIKPGAEVDAAARRLRMGDPPLVGRIEQDEILLDLRTVMPGQDSLLPVLINRALGSGG